MLPKREDRKRNPEKYKAWEKARYEKHKAERNARSLAGYLKDRDKILAGRKERRKTDPDYERGVRERYSQKHGQEIKKRRKEKYAANPDLFRALNKKSYAANAEKRREYARKYRELMSPEAKAAGITRAAENSRRWRAKNPGRHLANYAKRRALIRNATIGDLAEIIGYYEWIKAVARLRCFWCRKIIPKRQRSVDHWIPLARGGSHAVKNFVPACMRCNRKKWKKLPHEFTGQHELFV